LDELEKKLNHTKTENFKERVARQRIHFKKHLIKNYVQWALNV
jgi:hypothetical protein